MTLGAVELQLMAVDGSTESLRAAPFEVDLEGGPDDSHVVLLAAVICGAQAGALLCQPLKMLNRREFQLLRDPENDDGWIVGWEVGL